MHNRNRCGKNYDGRKNWVRRIICRKTLCKPKPHFHSQNRCGKPMWKSLWRMWKSVSYQQQFPVFAQPAADVENSVRGCEPLPRRVPAAVLRQWMFRDQRRRKSGKMLERSGNVSVKKRPARKCAEKFCENPPNFSRRMIFPRREILSVSTFHRRYRNCREK